jgi:hypothetical protein
LTLIVTRGWLFGLTGHTSGFCKPSLPQIGDMPDCAEQTESRFVYGLSHTLQPTTEQETEAPEGRSTVDRAVRRCVAVR